MEQTVETNSYVETQKAGEEFAKTLKAGDVVALYGDLGAGKTTFVQGMAKGLGIERNLNSPTFVIVRMYKRKAKSEKRKTTAQNLKRFYHIDLYRIETQKDIDGLGLEEILSDIEALVAIEWAEKIKDILPEKRIDVYLENKEEDKRKIIIKT